MDGKLIAFLLLFSGASVGLANEITNVAQCLNIELTQTVIDRMNPTNCSTHQMAYLGFIRGVVSGDYRTYLLHLTDATRIEECGTANLLSVTPQMTNEFHAFFQGVGYTNHTLKTYRETSTNEVWYLSSKLQSQKGTRIDVSQLDIQLVNTNGEWRVSNWDVDE